jgi:hypothetical protein
MGTPTNNKLNSANHLMQRSNVLENLKLERSPHSYSYLACTHVNLLLAESGSSSTTVFVLALDIQ